MDILTTIGSKDASVRYTDRPTVKVVITHNDTILLINNGLLPGGGVDVDESNQDAITRELQEELGITVKNTKEIGTVVQYRNLLKKKYLIHAYVAELDTSSGYTNPQDEGEAQFVVQWLSLSGAITLTTESIEEAKLKLMNTDANQGRLYNLMTTHSILRSLQ